MGGSSHVPHLFPVISGEKRAPRAVPDVTVCNAQPHEAPEAYHERKIKEGMDLVQVQKQW